MESFHSLIRIGQFLNECNGRFVRQENQTPLVVVPPWNADIVNVAGSLNHIYAAGTETAIR
jgi:hypothetical protein